MKTILSIAAFLCAVAGINAQTLTKAANEPVSGDKWFTREYDSTVAVPKSGGQGQVWNFTGLSASSQTNVTTYTTASSVTGYSNFPGANLAELKIGKSENGFFRTSGAGFEFLGFYDVSGSSYAYLSNSAIMFPWPISYGSSNTDPLSGIMTSGSNTVAWSGSITTSGFGSGTVILPNGTSLPNCLLVLRDIAVNMGSELYTEKRYSFFSTGNKFPVLELSYEASKTGTVVDRSFDADVMNLGLVTAIDDNMRSEAVKLYPNPANDLLYVSAGDSFVQSVQVMDLNGKVMRNYASEERVDVSSLEAGLYFIRVGTSSGSFTKKLVVLH